MGPKSKRKGRKETKETNDEAQRLKRERLLREIKLGKLNAERYRCFWRAMLTRAKIPDIVRKVEIAWQTLEHAFDLKDYSISLLLDSLQGAENQRRMANGAHAEVIERSFRAHQARLEVVGTLFFNRTVETTLADKAGDFENINYSRHKGETVLRKIHLLVNNRSENVSSIARGAAFSKIDAFVEDAKNEKRIIVTKLQTKLENLWNDSRNVFSDYRTSTADRWKTYEAIRHKDEIDQRMILRQYLRIAALLDECGKFREKIHSYTNESAIELREIAQEFDYFRKIYREANDRFISGRKKDKLKATTMSKEYNRSVTRLTGLTTKAEQILTYMQMCQKYETQDEKILPTIDNHPGQLWRGENDVFSLKTAVSDFESSINFWRRLGLARLIAAELRTERDQLLAQTNRLRESVKRFLTSVTAPTNMNCGSADSVQQNAKRKAILLRIFLFDTYGARLTKDFFDSFFQFDS